MSMILNTKLPQLMRGYPTVSDKYNVRGATLSVDSGEGHFGDVVLIDDDKDGYFVVADSTHAATATNVAGVLLATNVKLVTDFFGGSTAKAVTRPRETFNLMLEGYVALPVKVTAESGEPTLDDIKAALAEIKEGDDAKITTDGKVAKDGTVDLGWKFTGITEISDDGEPLAEVIVFPKNC